MISEKRTLPTDSSRYKQKCLSDKGIVRYAVLTLAGCSNSRTGRAPHTFPLHTETRGRKLETKKRVTKLLS